MPSPAAAPQHLAAVVITRSHETSYTPDEEFAFRHVRRHLGRWPIFALMPESHRAYYPGFHSLFYEPWLLQSGPGSDAQVQPPADVRTTRSVWRLTGGMERAAQP